MKAAMHVFLIVLMLAGVMGTGMFMEKVRPQDELVEYIYLAKGELTRKFAFGFNGEYADLLWTLSIQSFHKGFLEGTSHFRTDSIINHIKDPKGLAEKFRNPDDPLSRYLRSGFSSSTLLLIDKFDDPEGMIEILKKKPDSRYLRSRFSIVSNLLIDRYMESKNFVDILYEEKTLLCSDKISEQAGDDIATQVLFLLRKNGQRISPNTGIEEKEPDRQWLFNDKNNNRRLLAIKDGEKLAIYELKTPMCQYVLSDVSQSAVNLQRDLLENLYVSLESDLQQSMASELNKIVESENFYRKELFAHVKIPEDTMELLRQRPRGKDLLRLNRLLLEASYPHQLLKSPYFKNITEVFDLITDLDPHFQGVYEIAPRFLLVVKEPFAAIEMLEKGAASKEIREQPWIWFFLARIYISERFYLAKFREDDFRDEGKLLIKLHTAHSPVTGFLRDQFTAETCKLIDSYDGSKGMAREILPTLIAELNRLIKGPNLYDRDSLSIASSGIGVHFRFAKPFHRIELSKALKHDLNTVENNGGRGVLAAHFNRRLLEETYPDCLVKIEQKSTKLAIQALKKSVELGASDKIRQTWISIGKYDNFATLDILECVSRYRKAKKENDEVDEKIVLKRLRDTVARMQIDYIQSKLEKFKDRNGHLPGSLGELTNLPYDPCEQDIVNIADWLLENVAEGEKVHGKIRDYLQTWGKDDTGDRQSYWYDPKTGEITGHYMGEQRIAYILKNVQRRIDDFYQRNQRLPEKKDFDEMVKNLPRLPLGKKYEYAQGRIQAK